MFTTTPCAIIVADQTTETRLVNGQLVWNSVTPDQMRIDFESGFGFVFLVEDVRWEDSNNCGVQDPNLRLGGMTITLNPDQWNAHFKAMSRTIG